MHVDGHMCALCVSDIEFRRVFVAVFLFQTTLGIAVAVESTNFDRIVLANGWQSPARPDITRFGLLSTR
jgi:hypothetical protein